MPVEIEVVIEGYTKHSSLILDLQGHLPMREVNRLPAVEEIRRIEETRLILYRLLHLEIILGSLY